MTIKLPSFPVPSTQGNITLSKVSTKYVVLYFYPKDNTPGCTTESQDFRDYYAKFTALEAVIYGISRDSLISHEKFATKYELPFTLISDADEKLCQHFEVIKLKKLYGKEYFGIDRSTFLFKEGKLIKEWRGVKVPGHVDAVLKEIRQTYLI